MLLKREKQLPYMQKSPKVSIIYVNYNSGGDLIESIGSIIKSKPKLKYEIIVVDNSPKDIVSKKLKKFSDTIVYICNKQNTGYGAGNNLGISKSKSEHVFILNPDTLIGPKTIETLSRYLDRNKKAAIVAPNLIDKSGEVFKDMGSRTLTPIRSIFTHSFIYKIFPKNAIAAKYMLRDLPKSKLRQANAVPGSAFMIRKSVFEKVGMFDEIFFMYFEESDLGTRINKAGYKIFINPKAKVVHKWKSVKTGTGKLHKEFIKSRFYYFKKHYGLVWAMIVELFARVTKWHLALSGILAVGTFLRFYKLEENMIFGGELGHNYLAVKEMVISLQTSFVKTLLEKPEVFLLGPPTSHPWLHFGPLFYWLIAPVLIIGNYNPVFVSYFFALVFTLVIILNFFVVERVFDKPTALISSLFIAISPTWLQMTRGSRFFSLSVVMFYPFYYFLYKSLRRNGNHLFWVGLFYGLMLNFHLSGIILLPAILFGIFARKKKISRQMYARGLVGFVIANLPFLIHNLLNRFEMIGKFLVWVPYRIAGFLGFYPKNTADTQVIEVNLSSLYYFMTNMFGSGSRYLGISVFLLFIAGLVFIFKKRSSWKNTNTLLLFGFLLFGYVAIFFHGSPPSHYYMPLYPILVIIMSYFIARLLSSKRFGVVGMFAVMLLTITSLTFLQNGRWFKTGNRQVENSAITYEDKKEIANHIVTDSGGSPFSLSRVGTNDQFEGNYAQDYQYLMWLDANEPVNVGDVVVNGEKKAEIEYTIYEDFSNLSNELGGKTFLIGGVGILKKEIK